MKTTSYKLILLVVACIATIQLNAQNYRTGVGIRLASIEDGITLKHFVNPDGALEGIIGFRYNSFIITGLYEKHQAFPNALGLSWFFGGGAHVGFYRYGYYYYYERYHHSNYIVYVNEDTPRSVAVGLDFILGLEYKFQNTPITLGLDTKPFVDFSEGGPYAYWDFAFTARFTL